MNRIAINFICKNEAHVVERMLASVQPVADLIVGLDTGSTDNTVQLVKTFCEKAGIPVFMFSRPFDDFATARNAALMHLQQCVRNMGWDPATTWAFSTDCDETVRGEDFDKTKLVEPIYTIEHIAGESSFGREAIWRLDEAFTWKSPVHEYLYHPDEELKRPLITGICIKDEPDGASWLGDVEKKYIRYGTMLEAYRDQGNTTFRTLYYIADSYATAADHCPDKTRAIAHRFKAHDHYLMADAIVPESREGKYLLLIMMAKNLGLMDSEWPDQKAVYLRAFSEFPGKAEPVASIIEHYMERKDWHQAFLFSRFAYNHYIVKGYIDTGIRATNQALYQWRLMFLFYYCAMKTGKDSEVRSLYRLLLDATGKTSDYVTVADQALVRSSSPVVLRFKRLKDKAATWLKKTVRLPRLRGNQTNKYSPINQVSYAAQ